WTHIAGSGPLPLLLPTTPVDSYPRQLWPGWHTKQQHFAQRPDMVGQPRRHGGRTGPPLLRGAAAVGGLGRRQRQAQGGGWQTEVIVHMIQSELLAHAVLVCRQGG